MNRASAPSQTRRHAPPLAILGVPFDGVTTAETLAIVEAMIASRRPHYAATANVDFVVQALHDVELRRILADAHLVLCDGMPLVWASRWLGRPLPERVTGSDLVPRLLAEAEQRGWRVFFLGGTEASVRTAAEKTRARHPRLQLVGAYSPPFKPLLEMDHEDILRRIHEARPDLLLVAFGCPKQEKWINMHYRRAGVPLAIGVGATIDFLAGTMRRAPVWMQRTGTEWIFRLLQEPRRLAKRYGKDLVIFGREIGRQWWQLRPGGRAADSTAAAALTTDPAGGGVVKTGVRLDAAVVAEHFDAWKQAVAAGPVVFDLAATGFVDSTGLGAWIRLRMLAREHGHGLALAGAGAAVRSALHLMRLEEFFSVVPDMAAARSLAATESAGPSLAVDADGRQTVLHWQGELTAANAAAFGRQVETALAASASATVVVDLSALQFTDSSGVGLMLRLKKQIEGRGGRLRFINARPAVRDVLRLTRLEERLLGGAS